MDITSSKELQRKVRFRVRQSEIQLSGFKSFTKYALVLEDLDFYGVSDPIQIFHDAFCHLDNCIEQLSGKNASKHKGEIVADILTIHIHSEIVNFCEFDNKYQDLLNTTYNKTAADIGEDIAIYFKEGIRNDYIETGLKGFEMPSKEDIENCHDIIRMEVDKYINEVYKEVSKFENKMCQNTHSDIFSFSYEGIQKICYWAMVFADKYIDMDKTETTMYGIVGDCKFIGENLNDIAENLLVEEIVFEFVHTLNEDIKYSITLKDIEGIEFSLKGAHDKLYEEDNE